MMTGMNDPNPAAPTDSDVMIMMWNLGRFCTKSGVRESKIRLVDMFQI